MEDQKRQKMSGIGRYVFSDESFYHGEWVDGYMHGFGTYTFADGARFDGTYQDGVRHGYGTYTFASGAQFVGWYKDGKRDALGVYTFPDGRLEVGRYADGERDLAHALVRWSADRTAAWAIRAGSTDRYEVSVADANALTRRLGCKLPSGAPASVLRMERTVGAATVRYSLLSPRLRELKDPWRAGPPHLSEQPVQLEEQEAE